jgi:hypothetical protein
VVKDKFVIPIPLYNTKLHVCLNKEAYVKLTGDESVNPTWAGWSTLQSSHHIITLVELSPDVIAHELLHATFSILRCAGVQPSEDSEESYTYLLSFLIRETNKRIEKWQNQRQQNTKTSPPEQDNTTPPPKG